MNYFNLLKFSSPVVEEPKQYKSYFNIGHNPGENVIVWFLDNNLNFNSQQNKHLNHRGWNDYDNAEDDGNLLARGRYEINKGITSVYIHNLSLKNKQLEYTKKRIVQILDKQFNNPQIMFS